jgi:tetratricopeptide (TPR) repeat protein
MNMLLLFHLTKMALTGIIVLVSISVTSLFAQNNRIDSLKQKLAETPELESFEINFQLAREFSKTDNRMGLNYALKAKSLAYLKADSLNIVRSLRVVAQLFRRIDQLDSSFFYFLKGLPVASRNRFDEEHHAILNGLAVAYIFNSKYDQSLHYLLQCEPLYKRSEDKSLRSAYENNIGLVYYKLKDYKLALAHYNKSLSIKIAIKDNINMQMLLTNISLCNAKLGNLEEARKTINSILKKCPINCDDDIFLMAKYTSGIIWKESKNLDKAEKDFLQSYMLAKRSKNQRSLFDNIIDLTEIYLKQRNLLAAEKFLLEGEELTKISGFGLEEMKLYEQLCFLYIAKENYKKLSFYQEKYIQIKDSVVSEAQTNNLMRLHTQATEKENKTQLASQEQTLQLKDQIINKQSLANILTGIAVVLLATLIYVLTKIFLHRREANYLLNKRVQERSNELSQNQQSLKIAIEQRDVALTRLSQDLSNSIESMRSLCSAGSEMQADSNAQRYFDEINITTLNLSNSLSSILPEESKVA